MVFLAIWEDVKESQLVLVLDWNELYEFAQMRGGIWFRFAQVW